MYSQDIDRILSKIEKEAKNELAMFVQFGGSCFNLEDLERLRHRWQKNIHRYEVWHGGCILLCSSSFFWFPVSIALALSGLQAAAVRSCFCAQLLFWRALSAHLYFITNSEVSATNVGSEKDWNKLLK